MVVPKMRTYFPDLIRGEDPERDSRLDMYYGRVYIGPPVTKPDGDGWLMGCEVIEYGYDGSIVRRKMNWTTRLSYS